MAHLYTFIATPLETQPATAEAPVYTQGPWQSQLLHPLQWQAYVQNNWDPTASASPLFWVHVYPDHWDLHFWDSHQQQQLQCPLPPFQPDTHQALFAFLAGVAPHKDTRQQALNEAAQADSPPHTGGPLPTLLNALNLTPIFAKATQASHAFAAKNTNASDWFLPVIKACQSLNPEACPPSLHPPELLRDLYTLFWLENIRCEAVFQLTGPEAPALALPDDAESLIQYRTCDQGFCLAFQPEGNALCIRNALIDALYFLRSVWAPGQHWTLKIAALADAEDPQSRGLQQVFGGTVTAALTPAQPAILQWTHWAPATDHNILQEALGLAQWVETGEPLHFKSPEEYTATLQACVENYELQKGDFHKNADGAYCIEDLFQRTIVANRLCVFRHGKSLGLGAGLKAQDASAEKWKALDEVIQNSFLKPNTGEVLYAGKSGDFLATTPHKLPRGERSALELLQQELEALSFQYLGSMIWKPGGDVHNAVFVHAEHPTYVMIMFTLFGIFTEFFSYQATGPSLTTTNNPMTGDEPEKQITRQVMEDHSLQDMWQAHTQKIAQWKNPAVACPADLPHFLKVVDDFLVRTLG